MAGGGGEVEGFKEDLFLRGDGADEVVALTEEAVGPTFKVKARRD